MARPASCVAPGPAVNTMGYIMRYIGDDFLLLLLLFVASAVARRYISVKVVTASYVIKS